MSKRPGYSVRFAVLLMSKPTGRLQLREIGHIPSNIQDFQKTDRVPANRGLTMETDLKTSRFKKYWQDNVWGKVIAALITGAIVWIVSGVFQFYTLPQKRRTILTFLTHRDDESQNSGAVNNLDSISTERLKLLNGSIWRGKTEGVGDTKVPPFEISYRFTVQGSSVTGEGSFDRNGRHYDVVVLNGQIHDNYLRAEYKHIHGVDAYGFFILKIDQNFTTMAGKCLVLGSANHEITVGTLELTRIQQ